MCDRRYTLRFVLTFFSIIACLIFFAVKLVLIQVFRYSHLAGLAERQHNRFIEIEPVRGNIYDRNMRPLAFNIPAYSLFANPKIMSNDDKLKAIDVLSDLLKIDKATLKARLSRHKYFVWIKRRLTEDKADRIRRLHINGLGFRKESQRYYPDHGLASHVIGFTGVDNRGLEGVELYYDKELKGRPGKARVVRDARQRELMLDDYLSPPRDGFDLILTIDETIQYIVEHALDKSFDKSNARAATVIVADVNTGEILALANRPSYDLDNVSSSSVESRTNRAISYGYEPGSVFKIITLSAALEEGKFFEDDKIFCENGAYRVANHILHDHKPHGLLTFREVFAFSSNIGVTKIAQRLGVDIIYKYCKRFRIGEKTGIDLKGEENGILRPPDRWSKVSISAIPIGQEVMVTPIQLLCMISTIANKGVYMRPFVVKYIKDHTGHIIKKFSTKRVDRVISRSTAKRVADILVDVVEKGTGKKARIKGIKVAGKTGTAQKVVNGKYSHTKFCATFVGFAPADNPRIAAIVVFDEPHPAHFGGTVAAPVFKEIVENTLRYLSVKDGGI